MCGIVGYWIFETCKTYYAKDALPAAVARVRHRGPDDFGLWFSENEGVGLGHARLAILDLTEHGHQPMVSDDGRYVLVFNGEVYNFREIRSDLESKGFRFRGNADTEVVLASFQAWGRECVHRFIGMFAFAIWDCEEKRLLLCRDRVGVKPLYYGWDGRTLWFGSELKALRCFKHWTPEINRQALGEFFQYGYIAAPRTIYEKVYKLPPGHWLEIGSDHPEPVLHQYWSVLDAIAKGPLDGDEEQLADELEELLISAFKYRMVADVPAGVFLSGGIDSSILAAILQKHSGQHIHTFTIGFREDSYDESGWAKKVAEHLDTIHTHLTVDRQRAESVLSRLAVIYDEPFGDDSAIPTFLVSKMARRQVKVALSADGGDELFAGYTSYVLNPTRFKRIMMQPVWIRRIGRRLLTKSTLEVLARSASALSVLGSEMPARIIRKLAKLRHILPEPDPRMVFTASQAYWMPDEVEQLLGGYEDPRIPMDAYPGSFEAQMMLWDFHSYLPDDIMVKVDRATMSVSLEGREPLLDHRLIEFSFRLPLNLCIGPLGQKHLLRRILYRYVPRELIDRPKQGFAIPKNSWMAVSKGVYHEAILETFGYMPDMNMRIIHRELGMHGQAGVNESRVWMLYVAAQWYRKWMS